MNRYVFKPLSVYLNHENEDECENSLKEFLIKYKESLSTGEMFVDLTTYDIYIANNGLEYPIPIIKELRELCIEWIESNDNPLNILLKLNIDENSNSITSKIEKIDELMKKIKEQENELKKSDDYLNQYSRINHEVKYFYKNLSNYINNRIKRKYQIQLNLEKKIDNFYKRYIDLEKRYIGLLSRFESLEHEKLNYEYLLKYLEDEINIQDIINMSVESNVKLDKEEISDNPPNIELTFTIEIPKTDISLELLTKISNGDISFADLRNEVIDEDFWDTSSKYENTNSKIISSKGYEITESENKQNYVFKYIIQSNIGSRNIE